mgnify:CR=1 FL=1
MAKSPAHRFGQIIGDLLEYTLIRYCQPIAKEYGMYLDYKHSRPARNNQNEVRWTDINGNTHKLDIVIEYGGSEIKTGNPRAFIEMAWRRYTKHSKNKAQEISAAIQPLVSRYSEYGPFYGAVLAGEFTENSLNQMKSEGFKLLYFSINAIEDAFATQGIDAHWDENTSEETLQNRVVQLEALTETQLQLIGDYLIHNNIEQWEIFLMCLRNALERTLESISVVSLYGNSKIFYNVQEACAYIAEEEKEVTFTKDSFYRYEIVVKYSNGDKIDMQFREQQAAIASLNRLI